MGITNAFLFSFFYWLICCTTILEKNKSYQNYFKNEEYDRFYVNCTVNNLGFFSFPQLSWKTVKIFTILIMLSAIYARFPTSRKHTLLLNILTAPKSVCQRNKKNIYKNIIVKPIALVSFFAVINTNKKNTNRI